MMPVPRRDFAGCAAFGCAVLFCLAFVVFIVLNLPPLLSANPQCPTPTPVSAAAAAPPPVGSPTATAKPAVIAVVPSSVALKQSVVVCFDGLGRYFGPDAPQAASSMAKDPHLLVPFINGLPLKGLHPAAINVDPDYVRFYLDPTADSKATWTTLLRAPNLVHPDQPRPATLSVGFDGELPFPPAQPGASNINIGVIPTDRYLVTVGALGAFLGLLVLLAMQSDMLRVAGPDPQQPRGQRPLRRSKVRKPYSFGRTQFAWWLFIILASYAFILLITYETFPFTTAALTLLGISTATGTAAQVIENRQGTGTGTDSGQASKGLPRDLISDGAGVSIFRLQAIVFTGILSGVFLVNSLTELTMPNFDEKLLTLMGLGSVSAATYVAGKLTETPKNSA